MGLFTTLMREKTMEKRIGAIYSLILNKGEGGLTIRRGASFLIIPARKVLTPGKVSLHFPFSKKRHEKFRSSRAVLPVFFAPSTEMK